MDTSSGFTSEFKVIEDYSVSTDGAIVQEDVDFSESLTMKALDKIPFEQPLNLLKSRLVVGLWLWLWLILRVTVALTLTCILSLTHPNLNLIPTLVGRRRPYLSHHRHIRSISLLRSVLL
jgi:hypothetical protein